MKSKTYFHLVVLIVLCCPTFQSCIDDDPIPLRDPADTVREEIVIDFAATADSMQAATYGTYLGSGGVYLVDNQTTSQWGGYWPNAHALHTMVDAYERSGDAVWEQRMLDLLRGIATRNGGGYVNVFNDDMLWLANAAVRAHVATGEAEYLDVATFLWGDILESHSDLYGDGITWKKDTPFSKNAVSNGPTIVLALRLFDITQEEEYLSWAQRLYDWQKATLVDPQTGEVWDNINTIDGEIVINKDWIFTYNAGTWIGAGLRMFNVTGDETYFEDALRTALTATTSPNLSREGLMIDEGQGDGGLFKGILVRYMIEMALAPGLDEDDRKTLVGYLKFNGRTLYEQGLKRPEMIAGTFWRNMPEGRIDLTTQLSGLMLMEGVAKLER